MKLLILVLVGIQARVLKYDVGGNFTACEERCKIAVPRCVYNFWNKCSQRCAQLESISYGEEVGDDICDKYPPSLIACDMRYEDISELACYKEKKYETHECKQYLCRDLKVEQCQDYVCSTNATFFEDPKCLEKNCKDTKYDKCNSKGCESPGNSSTAEGLIKNICYKNFCQAKYDNPDCVAFILAEKSKCFDEKKLTKATDALDASKQKQQSLDDVVEGLKKQLQVAEANSQENQQEMDQLQTNRNVLMSKKLKCSDDLKAYEKAYNSANQETCQYNLWIIKEDIAKKNQDKQDLEKKIDAYKAMDIDVALYANQTEDCGFDEAKSSTDVTKEKLAGKVEELESQIKKIKDEINGLENLGRDAEGCSKKAQELFDALSKVATNPDSSIPQQAEISFTAEQVKKIRESIMIDGLPAGPEDY